MSAQGDYYAVLGVSREASLEEIRKAYRSKARDNHPDLNPGDDSAQDRLKDLNEAYEVLRDPEKRRAYDRFGAAGVRSAAQGGAPDFADLGEIFETFFGFGRAAARGRGRERPRRGADLKTKVRLSFEEAVFGTAAKVQVTREETCAACDGSGAAPGSEPITCAQCQGTGEVRRVQQSVFGSLVGVQTCPACRGRGETIASPCPECHGSRRTSRRRGLEVDIPAGVEDGTQIRLAGEGDHGMFGGPPGDLYVFLDVADHPVFERRGNDLHIELLINPADAALGGEFEVPTLEGSTLVSLHPGTQTGDEVRLPELGVPFLKRRGRGALVVTAFVRTPEKLSKDERRLLEELRISLPPAEVARRSASLWERVRDKFSS